MSQNRARVLVVAENVSAVRGGEAMLSLHYFRRMRARGIDARLLTHARERDPLLALLPGQADRIDFVPDLFLQRFVWRFRGHLPSAAGRIIIGPLNKFMSQLCFRKRAGSIAREYGIDLVHQPSPVSPKDLCMLFGLATAVVIGPLNGGMSFPAGFRQLEGKGGRRTVAAARWLSNALHRVFPGKLRADVVLVANERTRRALPSGVQGEIIEFVENGVDLSLWRAPQTAWQGSTSVRFVFSGRLVDWKGVDYLLRAFAIVVAELPATVDIIGDGTERDSLEALAEKLGIRSRVIFHGWLDQVSIARQFESASVFVLPSLWECGGAVVLEAMAAGLPVIATRWGGPADYLDESCGVLVDPTTPADFAGGLAAAMLRLARDPALRQRLASAALERVRERFDWDKKIDQMLAVYARAMTTYAEKHQLATHSQRSIDRSSAAPLDPAVPTSKK